MADYLRYQIRNIEPIRIADDSTSQSGQSNTLRYITGSTMRGVIINNLAKRDDFEAIKGILFSDKVRFMNAYITENGKELIPSIKGFYEDKTKSSDKKELENVVVDGKFSDGQKRASIGEYCYLEDDTIRYYSVKTGSDLKIKINLDSEKETKNVFRNDYIKPGYVFTGYIVVDDESVKDIIFSALEKQIILGNARSTGLGKCIVEEKKYVGFKETIFAEYSIAEDVENECYLALYSPCTMRNEVGEYCGLNRKALEKKLGVTGLDIPFCSTSTVMVRGYNRTLGAKIPSVPMYAQGSVFHLTFDGTLTKEAIQTLVEGGIGVRRNEGFGQILFLKDYANIHYKKEGDKSEDPAFMNTEEVVPEDDNTLKIAAVNYYRRYLTDAMKKKIVGDLKSGNAKNSQIGKVESLIVQNKYDSGNLVSIMEAYFGHAQEKEEKQKVQKIRSSVNSLKEYIMGVLKRPFAETVGVAKTTIMGYPVEELLSEEDENRLKMQYLLEVIRHNNRKGGRS